MKVVIVKLRSNQKNALLVLCTDLPAKILMSLSLFYQTFEFLIRNICNHKLYLTLLLCYCNARNKKWLVPYHNNWKTWLEIPTIINRFQQISQTLLSMCRTIMYIAKIVNSKLLLLSKASLKSCILSTNVMFGFMQKLVFIG